MTCPSSQPPPRRPRRHLLSNGPKTNESLSAPVMRGSVIGMIVVLGITVLGNWFKAKLTPAP